MHTLVPHEHHDELSVEEHELQHESVDNLMDYLELIFHVDMGDGHLEHFNSADGLDLELKVVTDFSSNFNLGLLQHIESTSDDFLTLNVDIESRVPILLSATIDADALRGPPTQS